MVRDYMKIYCEDCARWKIPNVAVKGQSQQLKSILWKFQVSGAMDWGIIPIINPYKLTVENTTELSWEFRNSCFSEHDHQLQHRLSKSCNTGRKEEKRQFCVSAVLQTQLWLGSYHKCSRRLIAKSRFWALIAEVQQISQLSKVRRCRWFSSLHVLLFSVCQRCRESCQRDCIIRHTEYRFFFFSICWHSCSYAVTTGYNLISLLSLSLLFLSIHGRVTLYKSL